ncbi:MAG: TlpA disulfide reductase family protein [Erythrobacter sp.]|jgi:thiol-disulfide isomerase/thioredoxin|nr:TlpA disulfide reductase family protein [Erythrobacter sp.]
MIRVSSVVVIAALALGGCDSAPADGVQQGAVEAPAEAGPGAGGEILRTRAGEAIPAMTVVDPDGARLDLAAIGQPVLLNLWATWCGPCKVEMPQLDALAGELAGEVRVLAVSQDIQGAEKVVPFFAEQGFDNLEPWMDTQTELGVKLAEGGMLPTTILYDAEGREVFRVAGIYEWDGEEAIAQIREALAQ